MVTRSNRSIFKEQNLRMNGSFKMHFPRKQGPGLIMSGEDSVYFREQYRATGCLVCFKERAALVAERRKPRPKSLFLCISS